MKLRVTSFVLYLLLFQLINVDAQSDSYFDEKTYHYHVMDTVSLMEVEVVSATKTDVNRNQVPINISVVDRETLKETTHTGVLSILSEQIPGVFVTERSVTGYGISSGSAGSVSIHGVGGGNKVLMLFDGQPMWAGVFGHSIADAYVASDAERVEVIKGPGSLLYGSNAMGGVINVITRKAKEDGFSGQGRLMYGSYNTQKYSANAGFRKNKLNIFASVNHDRSDGHRDNSPFYITNAYLRGGYHLSDNWSFTTDAILANFKVTNPGTITLPMLENWSKALRTTYSASVNNQYEKMSGSVQLYYNYGNHKIDDGYAAGGNSREYWFRSKDYHRGVALFESFKLFEGNQFTVGFDMKQWGGRAWNESKPEKEAYSELMDEDVLELAAYVVAQQDLFDCLTLNAGVRIENNERYGNEWIPQFGLSYRLSDITTIKASISKGFRSPNINEMFSPWGMANPDLEPERMWNYDISFLQSLFDKKMQIELTTYVAKGDNLIISVPKPEGNGMINMNSDEFKNKGFDFSIRYQVLPNLNLHANYSFMDSDVKLPAAPKHKAFLEASLKVGKFVFTPNFQYVDNLYLQAYSPRGYSEDHFIAESYIDYALLNCRATYKATDFLSLFINGENLTDTSYETYTGYPMPGIVVLGGVDFNF